MALPKTPVVAGRPETPAITGESPSATAGEAVAAGPGYTPEPGRDGTVVALGTPSATPHVAHVLSLVGDGATAVTRVEVASAAEGIALDELADAASTATTLEQVDRIRLVALILHGYPVMGRPIAGAPSFAAVLSAAYSRVGAIADRHVLEASRVDAEKRAAERRAQYVTH